MEIDFAPLSACEQMQTGGRFAIDSSVQSAHSTAIDEI